MMGLFITGVGTGVGKTLVTTILCYQLRGMGRRVSALKPVVSGFLADDPASDPVLILRSLGIAPAEEAISAISPWRFAAPISPHLAARRQNTSVSLEQVARFCHERAGQPDSIRLIEGVGGVMSPIASDGTCLDLIATLGDPAILVTGTYLGALSHTLTALAAMRVRAVAVRGVVVSQSAEDVGLAETVEGLRQFGAGEIPIDTLPRLDGDSEMQWRAAPPLTAICEADHE
jgi:dethiobiotin synthetase